MACSFPFRVSFHETFCDCILLFNGWRKSKQMRTKERVLLAILSNDDLAPAGTTTCYASMEIFIRWPALPQHDGCFQTMRHKRRFMLPLGCAYFVTYEHIDYRFGEFSLYVHKNIYPQLIPLYWGSSCFKGQV